jgi:peptidoglycan hydrolase-like protein with peptidoglycan-binding domain
MFAFRFTGLEKWMSDGAYVAARARGIHRGGRQDGPVPGYGARPLHAVDGDFCVLTKAAVEAFQASHGLGADGIVGQQTWNHLVNGYLAAPDPQRAAKEVFNAWEADDRDQAGKSGPQRA